MKYLFLFFTVISEAAAVICLKFSGASRQKIFLGAAVLFYATSFVFLAFALRQLPAGLANAVWAAGSIVVVAVAGNRLFHENLNLTQWICIALIIVGIFGVNYFGANR